MRPRRSATGLWLDRSPRRPDDSATEWRLRPSVETHPVEDATLTMLRPLAPPTRLRRRQDRPDRRQRPDAMLAIDHGCRTGMRVLEAWGLHALGLAREVASELFLSPRTVDSHPTDLLETRTAFANRAGAPRDRQPAEVRPRYRRRVRGDDGLDHGRVGPDHGPQVRTPHVRICGRELEQERAQPPGNRIWSRLSPLQLPTRPTSRLSGLRYR